MRFQGGMSFWKGGSNIAYRFLELLGQLSEFFVDKECYMANNMLTEEDTKRNMKKTKYKRNDMKKVTLLNQILI